MSSASSTQNAAPDAYPAARLPEDIERLVLPLMPDHPELSTVNAFVLKGGDKPTLVDCGAPGGSNTAFWDVYFRDHPAEIAGIIGTHGHMDHVGQAAALKRRAGAKFMVTRPEIEVMRRSLQPSAEAFEPLGEILVRAGLSEEQVAMVRGYSSQMRAIEPCEVDQVLEDGDVLDIGGRRWEVIVGGGHSPASVSLYCADGGLLFTGDQILPHLASFVGLDPLDPAADPLRDCITYMRRIASLPEGVTVLPGHADPFVGAAAKAAELVLLHEDRIARTAEAARTPGTCQDLLPRMFRLPPPPASMVHVLIGMAALRFCVNEGTVTEDIQPSGVAIYSAA